VASVHTLGQTHRHFFGPRQVKRYTANLPAVDRIELLKLKSDDPRETEIESTKTVVGAQAQAIASLWRSQSYEFDLVPCHEPPYEIKFYAKGRMIAFASVCWKCHNIVFIAPKLAPTKNSISFDAQGKEGQELLRVFSKAFPKTQGRLMAFSRTAQFLCDSLPSFAQ
jgi:hypothetical protein